MHGYTYIVKNNGSNKSPNYAEPEKIMTESVPADVYGMPSPCMEDFDGDGDLDLICGEFLDSFTWFENIGSRKMPRFTKGRKLISKGEIIRMDLEMMVVTSVDWDNDGDEDLICGNTAGYIGFIENLDGAKFPRWAEPVYLEVENKPIRIMAGNNGSIQGPCESKWGYTTLSVGDWDMDGLNDIVVNSIIGTVIWYKNIGKEKKPKLAPAQNIEVAWKISPPKPPKPPWRWRNPEETEMSAPWRTTPVIKDIDKDGVTDLVILDHEGYLAFFKGEMKEGRKIVLPIGTMTERKTYLLIANPVLTG